MEKQFFGAAPLVAWFGIVERRDLDSAKIGRCKVRIFGHHTPDKAALPTEALPDCYPMEPLSGGFWSTPKEGETVFGIFLDEGKQCPFMIGRVPTAEMRAVNVPGGEGFKDARSDLTTYPRQFLKMFSYSPSGIVALETESAAPYPPFGVGSSVPFRARNSDFIPSQISPNSHVSQAKATRYATAKGDTWFELPTVYASIYPFNHVFESESMHIIEFDDTPGAERVLIRHRLGSCWELFPDGSSVYKSVKDSYEVTLGNKKVGVSGDCDTHIKGNATLYIEGDLTQHVSGDYSLSVDGDFKRKVKGKEVININGDLSTKSDGEITLRASGNLWLKGATLQENSASTPEVESLKDFDLPQLPDNTLTSENQAKLVKATGSPIAANDDKDESVQSALLGELVNNTVVADIITCPVVENDLTPFASGDPRYRMQLSKYFQLADLCIRCTYPHNVKAQNGLEQKEIICNLAFLSQNILDPLSTRFPGYRINSGFRAFQNGKSQHELGEAVDLQWNSIGVGNLSRYLEIAAYIKDSLPFDQIILEHGNTIWLHVSLKRNGTNRKQVLTMKDGQFTPGLNLFGRT